MTTSLRRPEKKVGQLRSVRELDSFEIIPDHPQTPSGVPRSTWYRTRRAARWYVPYAIALVGLDYLAALLASVTAVATLAPERASSGFQNQLGLFSLIVYLLLPLTWLIMLWGYGGYDRRYLGVGTDEFKRVVRASWTVMAITAFAAFAFKVSISRFSFGVVLVSALVYILAVRYLMRHALYRLRDHGYAVNRLLLVGTLPETLEVHTAITRNRAAGMVPVAIHLSEG